MQNILLKIVLFTSVLPLFTLMWHTCKSEHMNETRQPRAVVFKMYCFQVLTFKIDAELLYTPLKSDSMQSLWSIIYYFMSYLKNTLIWKISYLIIKIHRVSFSPFNIFDVSTESNRQTAITTIVPLRINTHIGRMCSLRESISGSVITKCQNQFSQSIRPRHYIS